MAKILVDNPGENPDENPGDSTMKKGPLVYKEEKP